MLDLKAIVLSRCAVWLPGDSDTLPHDPCLGGGVRRLLWRTVVQPLCCQQDGSGPTGSGTQAGCLWLLSQGVLCSQRPGEMQRAVSSPRSHSHSLTSRPGAKKAPNASCSEPSFHQAHILWNGPWTQSQRCLLQECPPAHLTEAEVEAGEAWKLTKATGVQVQTHGS